MKKYYYAVKWEKVIRISEKTTLWHLACDSCFGKIDREMLIKKLGTNKSIIQTHHTLQKLLNDKAGWRKMSEFI